MVSMMPTSKVLRVENMSPDSTIGDLSAIFAMCDAITNIRLVEKEEEKMAFISFKTSKGVKTALSLTKVELKGRALRLYDAGSMDT